MSDETLLGDQIEYEATTNDLLSPFDKGKLVGASYNFSAGATIIIVNPESEGGITPIDLRVKQRWSIPPGRAAIVYSLEKVRMPLNMKGRLSMRSRLATKLLLFPGGPIHPGFKGYLFLPLANLSDVPIEIVYGDPIVTGEFIRLSGNAVEYSPDEYETIPPDRLPEAPPNSVFDLVELTARVSEIQTRLATLEGRQPATDATNRIVDLVVLGTLAGLGAGLGGAGLLAVSTELASPWNVVAGSLAGMLVLLLAVTAWLRRPPSAGRT